ncbi:hypothetical protein MJN85_30785, partial [Salmonella enterica subsp. enterica serovar Anatum]|nr:hypothetical protein [Salmonella enterica subsp. enterica serovar Anatum]
RKTPGHFLCRYSVCYRRDILATQLFPVCLPVQTLHSHDYVAAPQPGTSKQLEEEELLSEFKKGMNIVPVNPVVSKAEGDKCPRC